MNFIEPGFVDNGYFIRDSDTQGGFRFDGLGKKVYVNTGVTSITIADLFSRWEDWIRQDDNLKWLPAMRYSGKDPIPGGETGVTFFLINGWKLVYDPNVVAVSGVLFSEDYATPFWNAAGNPVYPATVSALVNSAVSYQNVVTGTALTEEQTANAVWQAAARTLTASADPTATQIAAAVWTRILEGSLTAEQVQRIMLAALAGTSQKDGNTITFKGVDGVTDRITGSFDAENNRTGAVLNGS